MLFSKTIKLPAKLIEQYRRDLVIGSAVAAKSEQSLYQLHLESLAQLEKLLDEEASIEELVSHVRSERHTHGWSFLSGNDGEKATTSAHILLTYLENQIFKIKGKDWYYSDDYRQHST